MWLDPSKTRSYILIDWSLCFILLLGINWYVTVQGLACTYGLPWATIFQLVPSLNKLNGHYGLVCTFCTCVLIE